MMMNIPFVKGHYDWNNATNTLEFYSDKDLTDSLDRKKRSRAGFQRQTALFSHLKDGSTPNRLGNERLSPSKQFRIGIPGQGARVSPRLGFYDASVSLDHVKNVALNAMKREKKEAGLKINPSFKRLLDATQFNNFLHTLLRYFETFLEGIDQQKRPHKTNFLQPSKAELLAMDDTKKKMAATKRHLGQAYCLLLLGIGMEEQHHMGCGKQRVSASHRDKKMYEDLYFFCTTVVYIAFRRREFNRIQAEVGDMLRSPIFNPSQHQGKSLLSEDNFTSHKAYRKDPRKPIGERVEELLAVKLPQIEKITPAAYRRQFGKRPAITKAVRQRSTALVSLLPLPEESSDYLFKPTATQRRLAKKSSDDINDFADLQNYNIYGTQKVGIIGEPMELFEPETLTLKNVDIEDDGDSRDTESPILQSNNDLTNTSEEKQRTISRATTEASLI